MKRFFLILTLALAAASAVHAEPSFGALSFETSEKTAFYAEGGIGNVQNFGFLLKGEGRELFLRHYTSSFSNPHSLRIKSLPDGEYTLSQYAKENSQLYLGDTVYITAKDGSVVVKTLDDLKTEAKEKLKSEVDMSLYGQSEQEIILEIISRMDDAETKEDIELLSQDIKTRIEVAKQNFTVLAHLQTALEELEGKRWTGSKKKIILIATGVLEEVIAQGKTGEALITDSYIRENYQSEIDEAKDIYYNQMSEAVKSDFQEDLMGLSEETFNFLSDFFGVNISSL